MSLIERMLKQTAVYWAPLAADRTGRPTYAAPVEIAVRWEDRRVEFMDENQEIALSNSVVFTASDVRVKGILMLGEITTSLNVANPKANAGAWEIRGFSKTPNLRVTKFVREAML